MKDNKYTVTISKQIRKVFLTQLVLSLVMGFLGLFVILQAGGIAAYISGVVMVIVQVHFMYARGYEIADHDLKSYSILKPYKWKGFALALPIVAVTFILTILYNIIWANSILDSGYEIILNFIYIVWIIPYYPFTITVQGTVNILGMLASVLIPTLFLGLGYILRMKNFDLSKVTDKIMYE